MAKIIAICGKICSGKTYYANQLKEKEKAVILSCDEITYFLFENNLGENHDEMSKRIWKYFLSKSVELIKIDCNVIIDWGFWTRQDREFIKDFYKNHKIKCEWHYIDIDKDLWEKNIKKRNKEILEGNGGYNYYLDEYLMNKLLSRWEEPTKDEIDIWHSIKI